MLINVKNIVSHIFVIYFMLIYKKEYFQLMNGYQPIGRLKLSITYANYCFSSCNIYIKCYKIHTKYILYKFIKNNIFIAL